MSVQQSRWFQHLPKKLYEYSGTELFHGCSAVQAKIVSDCPRDEDVSKATLTSGRGRGKNIVSKSWEREVLASPVSGKVGKLMAATPFPRLSLSALQ